MASFKKRRKELIRLKGKSCNHEWKTYRYAVNRKSIARNKGTVIVGCELCGSMKENSLKRDSVDDWLALPIFLVDYFPGGSKCSKFWVKKKKANKPSRREKYYAYLKKPEWKERRRQVFDRDKNTCQHCGGFATQVHHLTYKNVFKEPLEDLIAICRPCHEKEHGIEK